MVNSHGNNRPPLVIAAEWVSRITAVGLEMALPAGVGHWLDRRWGTEPWLVIAGAALGFTVGFRHLLQMLKPPKNREKN